MVFFQGRTLPYFMVQAAHDDSQDNHWLEFITRQKFLSSAIGLIQFSTRSHLDSSLVSSTLFHPLHSGPRLFRGTQREYSSKPLKHSIVERILVFKR